MMKGPYILLKDNLQLAGNSLSLQLERPGLTYQE
jgi:hypothetical protein